MNLSTILGQKQKRHIDPAVLEQMEGKNVTHFPHYIVTVLGMKGPHITID
jgi:hypothetical protein